MKFNITNNEILYPVPVYTHTTVQVNQLERIFHRNDLGVLMTKLCLGGSAGWWHIGIPAYIRESVGSRQKEVFFPSCLAFMTWHLEYCSGPVRGAVVRGRY